MGDLRVTVEHDVRIDANGARVHVTLRAQSSLAATAAAGLRVTGIRSANDAR